MKPVIRLLTVSLLLSSLGVPGASGGSDSRNQPFVASSSTEFFANDFDWREMVPYLYVAAGLPGEQGIKALLENSRVLRAYIANEVQEECRLRTRSCDAQSGGFLLRGEVSKRIDEIVKERLSRRHKIVQVDYPLTRQPFPFTDITALKTERRSDAYVVLDFAENSCTAAQLRNRYGAPYDTNVIEWYSVYRYKQETKNYTARASFKIDPIDGAVITVAISLKQKNVHK